MKNESKQIWLIIGGFILDNKGDVINYLNRKGYANLPVTATLGQVNDAVASNMSNPQFIEDFIPFIYGAEEYYNAEGSTSGGGASPIDIAAAISEVIQTISGAIQAAKLQAFQIAQALRYERYDREKGEWEKEQQEIMFRKQASLMLQKSQGELLLQRQARDERNKNLRNLMIFGVFMVGALGLTFFAVRLRKEKK